MSDVRNISGDNLTENFPALVDYLSHDRGAVMVIVLAIVGIRVSRSMRTRQAWWLRYCVFYVNLCSRSR